MMPEGSQKALDGEVHRVSGQAQVAPLVPGLHVSTPVQPARLSSNQHPSASWAHATRSPEVPSQ
jgi:hypothetical protein